MHSNMEMLVAGLMLHGPARDSRPSAAAEDEFYRTHAGWETRKRIAGLVARWRTSGLIFGSSRLPAQRQIRPEPLNLCDYTMRA